MDNAKPRVLIVGGVAAGFKTAASTSNTNVAAAENAPKTKGFQPGRGEIFFAAGR